MSIQPTVARSVLSVAAWGAFACNGPTIGPTGPNTGSIPVIAPVGLFPGDSAPAIAQVVIVLGGTPVTWASSDPGVATVTSSGMVTAVAPGTSRLTVTSQGASGSGVVTIHRESDLLGVTIDVCPQTLAVGQATVCRALANLQGGVSHDVSLRVGWSSTNPSVASSLGIGLVLGRSIGQTVVSAAYHGRTGARDLSVTGGSEDILRITAAAQQGPFRPGNAVSLTLLGFYSVVSGPSGQLSIRVSDQNGVIATTPMTVPQGGDRFLLKQEFTVPAASTRLCPAVVLQVGASSIVEPVDPLRFCADVVP